MVRRATFVLSVLSLAVLVSGCVQSGVARLPQRSDILVTSGDVEWNYEALAFIEIQQARCAPCGNLETWYEHLSESIKDEFRKHAKDLGATAVINVRYAVAGAPLFDFVRVIGTAIKPTGAAASIVPKSLPVVRAETTPAG